MKPSASHKAIADVKGKRLRRDLENAVRRIEKTSATDKELAGKQLSSLIRTTAALRDTLTGKARLKLVGALFEDGVAGELPHQWEKKEGYACDGKGNCTVVKQDSTCYRDTWTGACVSH